MERKSSPDVALASDLFDQFCAASTLKTILTLHRHLCEVLRMRPAPIPQFYPLLKSKLRSWRAQALWTKFDKRASHKCYARGLASEGTRVLIIGAGPCGLRAAIEAQLLGAKVVVLEKRDRISRNNVLHLWPFVIHDLRSLGAKKFFGKFCAGAIDHISIRQLQVILLKAALLLGVEVHTGVSFERLVPPGETDSGWRAETCPEDHPASQFEFDCLIGADGKRNTLEGFGRKEFRGKLAIAITANFLNKRSEAEARVEEISGVAFIFNQKFFRELYEATGIDLENIVYYKDDTHYFVMTAKKHSLLDKGVIISDQADTARLLHPDNVDKEALMQYAREAADFSSKYQLPHLEFAVNHYGQPDVAMFDFTSMYAAENASKVLEKNGHKLLMQLVGDSLLEPFWPTGSGCARGFLSSLDACWAVRSWGSGGAAPLEVLSERESIYRLLGQTTPENLNKDFNAYTLEPQTRYPNLNLRFVLPMQVRNLIATDNPASLEVAPAIVQPIKKRRREVPSEVLLIWLQRQLSVYETINVCEDFAGSFKDGLALCAVVHRYRPLQLDLMALKNEETIQNLQLAFHVLEKEAQIKPTIKAEEWASGENSDAIVSFLGQVYDAFRGEIPHIKQSKTIEEIEEILVAPRKSLTKSPKKRGSLEREPKRQVRKRRSHDNEESESRRQEIEHNREERIQRRRMMRHLTSQNFYQNMRRMQTAGNFYEEDEKEEKPEDFSLKIYRQHAPRFKDRVKEMEQKILYPDREGRFLTDAMKKGGQRDEKFSGRIKDLEQKFIKGNPITEKKPKDLHRAIGRIGKGDWNMVEIERKIEENKMGRGKAHGGEKVPKWSHDKFMDKITLMQSKLKGRSKEDEAKFKEIDSTLKRLDRKIREGSVLDPSGPRGANKVSAMAQELAKKNEPEAVPIQKSSSKGAFVMAQQTSDCHFCHKRVYLMERLSAEDVYFHRGCFRCEYCGTTLRQNNYAFDRDGRYGRRFVCTQHFGIPGYIRGSRSRRKSEDCKASAADEVAQVSDLTTPRIADATDALISIGATPERVEFENLAGGGSDDEYSEARPASGMAEMDEEAWTDHNFGVDDSSEENSDSLTDSEDDDAEAFEEANEDDALSVEGTRQLAESWKRRYSHQSASEMSDEDESSEWSCERDDAEDEDGSSTATEGDVLARELLLRQNQRLLERAKKRREEDSEGGSDCTSTETESDEEDEREEENLATEIETDSEFELDSSLPTILIDSELQVCHVKKIERGNVNKPTPNKYLQKNNAKNNNKPAAPPTEMTQAALKRRPQNLDLQPKEKVPLQPVKSTEGIASKTSLELKKKYLLGPGASAFGAHVQKSESASALDSRFRSFVSQISEQQKLLQPAAQPSPAMQSLIDNKLSPNRAALPLLTSLSTSNIINNRADMGHKLPKVPSSFIHICGRKSDPKLDDDKTPLVETKELMEERDQHFEDKESDKISDLEKEKMEEELTPQAERRDIVLENKNVFKESTEDVRPRSPAHETSIIVPDMSSWRKDKQPSKEESSESESESESETSSSESDDSVEQVEGVVAAVVPPRVEITEVVDKDVETELSDWAHDDQDNSLEMDVAVEARNITVRRPKRIAALAEEDDLSDLERVDVLTVTETKDSKNEEKIEIALTQVEAVPSLDEIVPTPVKSVTPPPAAEVVLTPVEVVVTPVEIVLTPIEAIPLLEEEPVIEEIPVKKESPAKVENPTLTKEEPVALQEDDTKEENSSKTCSLVDVMTLSVSSIGEGIEDINFADSSDETEVDSQKEVDVEEDESSKYQPLAQVSSSTNTESKSSDRCKTPDVLTTPDTEMEKLLQDEAYEAHVHRLQDRVSPFGNAKDSIDIRKARRSSSSSTSTPSKGSPAKTIPSTPSTSRKIEELNRERSRQKSLIEDLVMAKIPQKSTSIRRRLSSKSPSGATRMPLTAPPPVPPPPVEPTPPPVPPPPLAAPTTPRPVSALFSSVKLPETPLTHPEAFSCPDILRAVEGTPVAPPRTKKKGSKDPQTEPVKGAKRERRKSLIQAVSDLFSRSKKDSPEKAGSVPPLPPPPTNYPEDSPSDGEDSKTFSIEGSLRRSARSAKKAARQAQLKRLRLAHELKRQLEESEEKQRKLERRGVVLEKALKGEGGQAAANEAELLQEWFALMRQLSELRRQERELAIKAQELELQERHSRLQADLRERMALDVEQKSSHDVEEEGKILGEILEIVEQRNCLSNQLEEERQRYADEDKDLEAQMLAKGLRLTPLRKESNV